MQTQIEARHIERAIGCNRSRIAHLQNQTEADTSNRDGHIIRFSLADALGMIFAERFVTEFGLKLDAAACIAIDLKADLVDVIIDEKNHRFALIAKNPIRGGFDLAVTTDPAEAIELVKARRGAFSIDLTAWTIDAFHALKLPKRARAA